MAASAQKAVTFSFPEKGSRILTKWREQQEMQRAISQRTAMAMRSGFAGAAVNRLTASLQTWSGALNADLDAGLPILRARARALAVNYEFARRYLSLASTNIVGPDGATLQVRARGADGKLDSIGNDTIEAAWKKWCLKCDLSGRVEWAQMCRMIVKHVARDGEMLMRIVRDKQLFGGLQLQMLEPDRLDENYNQRLNNGSTVRMGVELDSYLRPVAYYIRTRHPGENFVMGAGLQLERVAANDIIHIYLPERAEQVRGYSWFHAVIGRASMLQGYEEAAIVAARVGAAKVGVFERDGEGVAMGLQSVGDGKDPATGNVLMDAQPGEFVTVPEGYKLSSWNPEYPHANYESFISQCMRGLAAGLDVAAHNLSGNMTEVNYSSARIAEMAERDLWRTLQNWFCSAFVKPVYAAWLQLALARGEIALNNGSVIPPERFEKFYDASVFVSRSWAWVDPLNDVKSAREEIAEGLNSRTAIAAAKGREFDDIVEELRVEQEMLALAGIVILQPGKETMPPAAPAAQQASGNKPKK